MGLSPSPCLMWLGLHDRVFWPWEIGASRDIRVISFLGFHRELLSTHVLPWLSVQGMAKALLPDRGKGRLGGEELGPGVVLILIGHPRFCSPILEPTQRPRTVCERWRESLLEHYGGTPRDDQYVPQCDDLGHFIPLQCHGKSDFCWCVDKDGRELQGTRSQPGTVPACKHGMAQALLCVIEGFLVGF